MSDDLTIVSRRHFVAGAAVAVSALGCERDAAEDGAPAAATTANSVPPFELDEVSLEQLAEGMRSGRWTARRITELYLERIEAIDRAGPTLRSVIETNPEALDSADQLDGERRSGNVRGPLHGIPILLKDNVGTADRMSTTAGSFALEGNVPAQDAFIAQKLRAAGAILLGKANLSEWANFRSTHSSSGWSARGGQCRNPYVLDRNPCGSSSGSGAAVAASLCGAAIGTETDGSVVCPSSANGIVGIKPTVGLASRTGIIPISHTQDTAGPMARTVRDAAVLLGALTGADPQDAATAASGGNVQTDYTQYLEANGLQGARIGVARDFFGFNPAVDALMEQAISLMSGRGAVIVDDVKFQNRQDIDGAEFEVLLFDFKADIAAYLGSLANSSMRTLADLIAFNDSNRDRELAWFGQEIFLDAEKKGPLTSGEYRSALATCQRLARAEGIDAVMNRQRLDALIAPTGGPAWPIDLINGDHYTGGSSTLAAVAGYPNITVPAGDVRGLPIGISFFGRAWSEPVLLRIAYAFEQASTHRKAPQFLATLVV
jgi:amidase